MDHHRRLLAVVWDHRFPRFAALAAAGFTFDLTTLALLNRYTPLPSPTAVTLAFWATYALNFALNRRFAFRANDRPVGPQLARFVPQVLGDYLLTLTAVLALQAIGVPLVAARIIAGGTNLVFNYVLYRWWTFRRSGSRTPRSSMSANAGGVGRPQRQPEDQGRHAAAQADRRSAPDQQDLAVDPGDGHLLPRADTRETEVLQ
ncbi:GtrA family protein [Plantactinospora mayteni]|uniref:GtrA family protein n=1 Tax=Plantactinospora mayteni TaxID=566021 RepID=UPI0019421289|nr:GtrA family protein [Plantactinospora mayteni]